MYGTVARLQLRPDAEQRFAELAQEFEGLSIDGHVGTYVYRSDANPHEVWMAVAFRDRAAYRKNAESPEQDARFQKMRALLTADLEWHDGEIIFPQR